MIIDDDKRRDAMIDEVRETLEETHVLLAPLKLQAYLSEVYSIFIINPRTGKANVGNYQSDYQFLLNKAKDWIKSNK